MTDDPDREFELIAGGSDPDLAAALAAKHGTIDTDYDLDEDGVTPIPVAWVINPELVNPTPEKLEEIREHRDDR
jgi:hypothetical protein